VNLFADDPAAAVGDEACAESLRVMVLICACATLRRQQSPAEVNEALLPRQRIYLVRVKESRRKQRGIFANLVKLTLFEIRKNLGFGKLICAFQ
jgi:hypothetical protein